MIVITGNCFIYAIVFYLERKNFMDLTMLFLKTKVGYELRNDIVKITTFARVIINIVKCIRNDFTDIIANRSIYYLGMFSQGVDDLKNISDTYGNIASFSEEFKQKYGSLSLYELNLGQDYYYGSNLQMSAINCTFETALNKYISNAILAITYLQKQINGTISTDEFDDLMREFFFINYNGKTILRNVSEEATNIILKYIQSTYDTKKMVKD